MSELLDRGREVLRAADLEVEPVDAVADLLRHAADVHHRHPLQKRSPRRDGVLENTRVIAGSPQGH